MTRRRWRFLPLAQKELDDIVRERTILAAIMIQFVVAAFSAFLLVGLTGLYDPASLESGRPVPVAYVGPGGFVPELARADTLLVTRTTYEDAFRGFEEGRYTAVVEETYLVADGTRFVEVLVPEDEFQTTLVVAQMRALLQDYEERLREDRSGRLQTALLDPGLEPAPARDQAFTYGALLPLLVLMPAMLAGAITADSFLQERSSGTLRLLLASPLSAGDLIVGKMLVPVLLAPAQVGLWLLLLSLNGIPIENPHWIMGFALLAAWFFAALGVIVAGFVPVEGQAQATYALALIVASFLGFLLPRDPLNLVALLATGTTGDGVSVSLGLLALLTAGAAWAAWHIARRRLLVPDAW